MYCGTMGTHKYDALNMEKHEFDVPDEKIMKELNSAFEGPAENFV